MTYDRSLTKEVLLILGACLPIGANATEGKHPDCSHPPVYEQTAGLCCAAIQHYKDV